MNSALQDNAGPLGIISSNTGVTVLANDNSYTGTTMVNAGTVRIGAGEGRGTPGTGDITIAAGATLDFARDATALSVANTVTNAGTLQVTEGNLALTGAATSSGTTNAGDGTGAAGSAVLALGDGATAFTYTNTGTVNVRSDGLLLLDDTTVTSGSILVEAGGQARVTDTVTLSDALLENSGSLVVSPSATLQGDALGILENRGSMVMGEGSSVSLTQDFTQTAAGSLSMHPTSSITTLGAANLAGTLSVTSLGSVPVATYTLVDAAGGVSGAFSNYADDAVVYTDADVEYVIDYTTGQVLLVPGTPPAPASVPAVAADVMGYALSRGAGLAGTGAGEIRVPYRRTARGFRASLRASEVALGLASPGTGELRGAGWRGEPAPAGGASRFRAYAQGSLARGTRDDSAGRRESESEHAEAGFFYDHGEDLTLGLSFGHGEHELRRGGSRAETEDSFLTLLAWKALGRFGGGVLFLESGLGAGTLDASTWRDGGLSGATEGASYHGQAKIGFTSPRGDGAGCQCFLTPYAGVGASHLRLDAYTESGGAGALSYGAQDGTLVREFAGVDWDYRRGLGRGGALVCKLSAEGFLAQRSGDDVRASGGAATRELETDDWGVELEAQVGYEADRFAVTLLGRERVTEHGDGWEAGLHVGIRW